MQHDFQGTVRTPSHFLLTRIGKRRRGGKKTGGKYCLYMNITKEKKRGKGRGQDKRVHSMVVDGEPSMTCTDFLPKKRRKKRKKGTRTHSAEGRDHHHRP